MRRTAGHRRRSGGRRALPLRRHADAHLTDATIPGLTLHLEDFRNFQALDWSAPAGRLLLVGPNGAGKTTLLEAVYLAATGRSFRAPRLELCARNGGERFLVHAEVGAAPRRCLEHVWTRATGSHRSLDGKSARLPEQLMALPLLVWTRAESELVAGPPAVRRRFFDRGLVQLRPALWSSLGRFERALAAKRALLAAGGSSGATARELASWNELLARHGAEIAAGRAQLVAELDAHLARLRATSFDDLPELALRYRPSPPAAAAGEAALREALAALAPEERRRRQPLSGAQRDEIEILWAGGEARRIASAGERKAVGLLLLVALAERLRDAGREPALLVDDADAELDHGRVDKLVALVGRFEKLLLTSSRPEVWPAAAGFETVRVDALPEPSAGAS